MQKMKNQFLEDETSRIDAVRHEAKLESDRQIKEVTKKATQELIEVN